jgi:hypothetical protein
MTGNSAAEGEGRGFIGCGKMALRCHSDPTRCHPEAKPKDLCHFAQGELLEESRHLSNQANTKILRRPKKVDSSG